MTDYSLGKIYAIRTPHTDKAYFGSTTQDLDKRFTLHKSNFKTGNGKGIASEEILKFDDAFIQLMENYPCNSKDELERQEQCYIDHNKDWAVNKQAAFNDLRRNGIREAGQ